MGWQRQLQYDTRINSLLEFGASYIRDFAVYCCAEHSRLSRLFQVNMRVIYTFSTDFTWLLLPAYTTKTTGTCQGKEVGMDEFIKRS